MSWFAKRPLAQSRAAVLCSLLPWPEDATEQQRVQAILKEALGVCQDPDWYSCKKPGCDTPDCSRKAHMQQASRKHAFGIVDCAKRDPSGGYDAARTDVLRLLKAAYPDRPAEMLDPFSGRGLIPLEASRYEQKSHAIDYSPVAALASRLLIDWPFRDWSAEPELPFAPLNGQRRVFNPKDPHRLLHDIELVQAEVQRRLETQLDEFYPNNDLGEKPWGYLWAQVIPCDGCGREFPLYGANVLKKPNPKTGDVGSSFEIRTVGETWSVEVVMGVTSQLPTMRARAEKRGKLAWCPFTDCGHGHERDEHKALAAKDFNRLEMLVVSDLRQGEKVFRTPTPAERVAAANASERLNSIVVNGLPGRPTEAVPIGTDAVVAGLYGAKTFGDLSVNRQNLLHATAAQAIADIVEEAKGAGCSHDYASALAGYCAATLARKLKRSTRGAALEAMSGGGNKLNHVFANESSVGFNYDFFESGPGFGPGTWRSVSGTTSALAQILETKGRPAEVQRGSALKVPLPTDSLDAVITDPPYGMYIDYSDSSDLFYVWLRRALAGINPDFAMTSHPHGVQEKAEEIITKRHYNNLGDHRTPEFYKSNIAKAFREANRVVHPDGVVSIVFGHGDPEAWKQLLDAIAEAGLVLTGAWPANTEKGGQAGSANIQTTLTLACRPAPADRPQGRVAEVDAEMRRVIAERVQHVWNPAGLSYVDQKMAASGPALEVVGRYSAVLNKSGQPVDLDRYLPLARRAVTEAHNLSFDSLPLDTFDQKTRFALEWVRSHGRQVQAASEARWNRLASDLEEGDTAGVLKDVEKGVRLAYASESKVEPSEGLSTFEVALASAHAWKNGTLADAAAAIRDSKIDGTDPHFWACVRALSQNLPETDRDGSAWTSMVRNRDALVAGVANAEVAAAAVIKREQRKAVERENSPMLFEDPNSLFGREDSR